MESHWFTLGSRPILSLVGKRKAPRKRRREMAEGKDDNIVTRDANLVGTLMDDEAGPPYFHELEEDTIAKLRGRVLSN